MSVKTDAEILTSIRFFLSTISSSIFKTFVIYSTYYTIYHKQITLV